MATQYIAIAIATGMPAVDAYPIWVSEDIEEVRRMCMHRLEEEIDEMVTAVQDIDVMIDANADQTVFEIKGQDEFVYLTIVIHSLEV